MTDDLKSLLKTYINTHEKIYTATNGLSDEEKNYKPFPDKWSIREIINHLCDSEIVALNRLLRIATENNPLLPVYDQNLWASEFRYNLLDDRTALLIFGLIRTRMIEIIQNLPPEVWTRTGNHEKRGVISFYDIFKLYSEHGESHLNQIQEIISSMKK